MSRTAGALNQDHQAKRLDLARRVLQAVVEGGSNISLNELARETGQSVPTLKHYFGDRAGAVAEALRSVRQDASTHIASIASPGALGLPASLTKVANDLAQAWVPFGVGKLFAVGMAAGLFERSIGPAYLDGVLEPTVLAMEARLRTHAERGELSVDPGDALAIRTAALGFLSPLLVALLHQTALEGATCRPLDLRAFIREHVERFMTGYVSKPAAGAKVRKRKKSP
jgi:AcrR family transcriptional regulator